MCEHGDTVPMVLPRKPVSDPYGEHATYQIDRCIAPLVAALNTAGITTLASCCGHGKGSGSVALADGRWLIVAATKAEWDEIDAATRDGAT